MKQTRPGLRTSVPLSTAFCYGCKCSSLVLESLNTVNLVFLCKRYDKRTQKSAFRFSTSGSYNRDLYETPHRPDDMLMRMVLWFISDFAVRSRHRLTPFAAAVLLTAGFEYAVYDCVGAAREQQTAAADPALCDAARLPPSEQRRCRRPTCAAAGYRSVTLLLRIAPGGQIGRGTTHHHSRQNFIRISSENTSHHLRTLQFTVVSFQSSQHIMGIFHGVFALGTKPVNNPTWCPKANRTSTLHRGTLHLRTTQ